MRRRPMLAAAALALTMATPGRAAAQESTFQPPNLFEQKKPAPKPPSVDWSAPQAKAAAGSQPSVVCGMTVVPADPKVDPKIRVAPPDSRTTYAMRVVPPPVCARK